jgi:hypothetical protein
MVDTNDKNFLASIVSIVRIVKGIPVFCLLLFGNRFVSTIR